MKQKKNFYSSIIASFVISISITTLSNIKQGPPNNDNGPPLHLRQLRQHKAKTYSHAPEPVAAAHVHVNEIDPQEYTGLMDITERFGDILQYFSLPIVAPYILPYTDPRMTFTTTLVLNHFLFIPIGKTVLRWPQSRLPVRNNPLHKDRELNDWLYRATKNICAHTYNQSTKLATSYIAPYILAELLSKR